MHRAAAAEGQQAAVPPVDPPLHRDPAQRPRHRGVSDPDDTERRFRHVQPQRLRRAARSAAAARAGSMRDAVAEQRMRIEIAEHDVRVGDRRLQSRPCRSRPARARPRRCPARPRGRRVRAARCEPPPAPIDCTASIGWRSGRSPVMRSSAISATPSTIRQTSVVVPPMSNVSTRLRSSARARRDRGGDAGGRAGHRHHDRPLLGGGDRDHAAGRVEHLQPGAERQPRAPAPPGSPRRSAWRRR